MEQKQTAPIPPEIELRPDGEERFLAAVRAAVTHGAMHRDKNAQPSVKDAGKRKLRRFAELARQ